MQETNRKTWSSSFGFIIACVGSAVGLGNIWKFPYIAHQNGGGAFVLIYLIAVVVVGYPIMVAELSMGRHARLNAYGTFKKLSRNSIFWKLIGVLCIFSSLIILSYYSVVAGWTIDYFINSVTGSLQALTPETVGPRFGTFVSNGPKQIIFHTVFMLLTSALVWKGVSGIEKAVKVLMPVLGVLIAVIAGVSIYNYGAGEALGFLFKFDFSTLTPHSVLEAVGHAFFTLSLGLGVMIIYGSYLPKGVSIVRAGAWITFLDTLIALMACMMMYPIIFGTNMEVSESAAILFTTLTVQFNALPGGAFISALFYVLVAFAALSSTISLLEPVVSFFSETFKVGRKKSVIICSFGIWVIGLASALSNGASQFFTDLKCMDRLDYLTSNWTLPIGGMFIAIFCGWFFTRNAKMAELTPSERRWFYGIWNFSIRFLSPVLVLIVILYKIGVI